MQPHSVCWRSGAVRLPRLSRAKRSVSRAAICSGASTRRRAAASSIASGSPSSRWQISATATQLSARRNVGSTASARAVNRATDSNAVTSASAGCWAGSGAGSCGTGYTASPINPSGSRLVATIRRSGQAREQRVDHRRASGQHVFAVVQHQQQAPRREVGAQRLHRRPGRLLRRAERGGDEVGQHGTVRRVRHRRRVQLTQLGQIDEPGAVREGPQHLRRRASGQPGLAHPADAAQRHQPELGGQPFEVRKLTATPDKAAQIGWEVAASRMRAASYHRSNPPNARAMRDKESSVCRTGIRSEIPLTRYPLPIGSAKT